MNYNIERLKKLEYLLIPLARIDLEEHRRSPEARQYELRLNQLELEARERLFAYLAKVGEQSRGILEYE